MSKTPKGASLKYILRPKAFTYSSCAPPWGKSVPSNIKKIRIKSTVRVSFVDVKSL